MKLQYAPKTMNFQVFHGNRPL